MVAQIIPAKLKAKQKSSDPQKLRVAAYARVSTDSEEQQTSYGYKNDSHNPRETPYGFALLLDDHHDNRCDDDSV